ncbi:uncharacterized protein DUF3794 [Hydrogenispora ethanolica]|jgi:hypothetical protein|uniref:Uncharacterized protein DUF3794 n=1 Tax=Hydrogenispora ethanolica TaxID=1082276 RepID=A0A4R1RDP4_HYDET|nr:DUF3794 domain-containing protein [Hydrogenispora ethanolica]TCL63750.1 uncharacterized protein DUF3794 [Hydrogenispora ethanolica]
MAVLAETTAQVLVSDTVTLPVAAEKISEIVASVRDTQCFVIENKVIFLGTLHKQIFFVDQDGFVRHVGVDIPFSGFADTPGVPAGSSCQLTPAVVFLNFSLVSPTELQENVVIDINIVVTDDDPSGNTVTFSNTLPVQPLRFGAQGTVRVSEAGFHMS